MDDPFNPTPENIRAWASDPAAQSEQDWDLVITDLSTAPLLIELAADPSCPKRRFFLSCLYLLVGDAVRTQGRAHSISGITKLLDAAPSHDTAIAGWIARSRDLLAYPDTFDYEAWCHGGLVRADTSR